MTTQIPATGQTHTTLPTELLSTSSPGARRSSTLTYPEHTPAEIEDAVTILEFLAWGRRKYPTYQDATVQNSHMCHSPGDVMLDDERDNARLLGCAPSNLCQILLPSQRQVYQLVKYHCECLLWYHGSFHATTFMQELNEFYTMRGGHIDKSCKNLQWTALLFAILASSMACAPRSVAQAWGFRSQEQDTLSKRWLKATTDCLNQSDFMAHLSIYSVEAITTLTMSAHMLGYSNGLSVLLASAVRVAQGLGLHQLGDGQDDHTDHLIERETGRRVWCQLCTQDWFSIPFTESYLIHRRGFTTEKPRNCNDDMEAFPEDYPTIISFSRLKHDIAALMPDLQDDLTVSNDLYTKYEEVLKYDRRMRTLATQHLPYYLQNVPLDPAWPCYVPWARRSLAISSAHKIIMIHRKFLSASFINPLFEFTRKTCVAASRTILKEQKEAPRDGGPVLWVYQAFSVTACIILCLDIFHHEGAESEISDHRQLIEDGIENLSRCQSDMIAKRGVSLLKAMLADGQQRASERQVVTAMGQPENLYHSMHKMQSTDVLDISSIIQGFYQQGRFNSVGEP